MKESVAFRVEFFWEPWDSRDPFWTNWSVSNSRHDSLESARRESEKLEAKHPDKQFRVVRITTTEEVA